MHAATAVTQFISLRSFQPLLSFCAAVEQHRPKVAVEWETFSCRQRFQFKLIDYLLQKFPF